ncbi:MAG: ParA family protein [Rhodospirillaceae bacterium]
MFVLAVANTKGGAGKTTIATHLAASFAQRGFRTALADLDRQKSALGWLKRRPKDLPKIEGVNLSRGDGIPKHLDRLVVDAAAAMGKGVVKDVVTQADMVVIPVLPSAFDEDGTLRFIKHLMELKAVRRNKREVVCLANRIRPRTKALTRLEEFLASLDFPAVARLRDTQSYATMAAEGTSLFDVPGARLEPYRAEWAPLLDRIEREAKG